MTPQMNETMYNLQKDYSCVGVTPVDEEMVQPTRRLFMRIGVTPVDEEMVHLDLIITNTSEERIAMVMKNRLGDSCQVVVSKDSILNFI